MCSPQSISTMKVICDGFKRSFTHQGVIQLFERMNWTSCSQKAVSIAIGIVIKLSMIFAIDGSMIYTILQLSSDDTGETLKVFLIVGLILTNLGELLSNMGTVWSEFEEKQKRRIEREEYLNQADEDRKRYEEDRKRSEQRHQEIISAIAATSGIADGQINNIVRDFKTKLFEEHKQSIIKQINGAVVDHTNTLDVMNRYQPEDHMTHRERIQRALTNE